VESVRRVEEKKRRLVLPRSSTTSRSPKPTKNALGFTEEKDKPAKLADSTVERSYPSADPVTVSRLRA